MRIFSGSHANFVSEPEIARTRVNQGATNSTHRRIGLSTPQKDNYVLSSSSTWAGDPAEPQPKMLLLH
jgi:hypothetical protein